MRTLQQIMDSLEQAIYLRAQEKQSDLIREELLSKQRCELVDRVQSIMESMGKLDLSNEDGPILFYQEIKRYLPYFEQFEEIEQIYEDTGRAPQ